MQLLAEAGVDAPARMLAPLSGAALDNTLRLGDAALTGPISRGDARTVREHVTVLRRVGPDVLATYVAMARRTADCRRPAMPASVPPASADWLGSAHVGR
jgi:predicted short-subunit dehydrogenase-like oxidoreductase (DUF2520 family)